MGNVGGIERIMVFGILIIIVTILAIAFYTASQIDENDLNPGELSSNRMRAAGMDDVVKLGASLDDDESAVEEDEHVSPFFPPSRNTSGMESLKANSHANRSNAAGGGQPVQQEGVQAQPVSINSGGNTSAVGRSGGEGARNQPRNITEYKIKKGDSFMKIARVLYGDEKKFQDIINANPDIDPWQLQIGQTIKLPYPVANPSKVGTSAKSTATMKPATQTVPAARTYKVQTGDTLVDISIRFYGKSSQWKKIYTANRAKIANPDVLPVGAKLTIP
jgi:nucleoid-associated protein YgaU